MDLPAFPDKKMRGNRQKKSDSKLVSEPCRPNLANLSQVADIRPTCRRHAQLSSLLQCLHQPPVSHDLEFMAKQAQWDYLVEKFIATHNPACSYMELQQQVISRVPIKEGIVSKRFKKILISSIDSPHCFSNTAISSSVIIDSGASVCVSLH